MRRMKNAQAKKSPLRSDRRSACPIITWWSAATLCQHISELVAAWQRWRHRDCSMAGEPMRLQTLSYTEQAVLLQEVS
jgi:hypothetical protein